MSRDTHPPQPLLLPPEMDFQVVVLAGGTSEKLSPLVSKVLYRARTPPITPTTLINPRPPPFALLLAGRPQGTSPRRKPPRDLLRA